MMQPTYFVCILSELKVVLTGNNRASKRYACGRNPDARVVISLKLHQTSYEEMIRKSLDHNTDCNFFIMIKVVMISLSLHIMLKKNGQ